MLKKLNDPETYVIAPYVIFLSIQNKFLWKTNHNLTYECDGNIKPFKVQQKHIYQHFLHRINYCRCAQPEICTYTLSLHTYD